MKLPKKIKVGGFEYKVICPYIFKERSDVCGQHDYDLLEIRLSEESDGGVKISKEVIFKTFIHEVLHAIDVQTGQKMFLDQDGEAKIEALSSGIYQVLVDNNFIRITG